METFASLREYRIVRINENKDRFIQKNTLLTDEQKQEVLDFFHSHANLEAKVNNGNWNYNIPYEEFKRVINSVDSQAKRLKKQTKELRKQNGLEGLVEGEDYSIFKETSEYIAYKPLTHKAMRVIASNMVEPKLWCESSIMDWTPKEVLPEDEPMKDGLYPGAKWCVAMETDEHWEDFTHDRKSFIVVCRKQANLPDNLKKLCAVIQGGNIDWEESVDASDTSISELDDSEVDNTLESLFLEDLEVTLSKVQKYYDPSLREYVIPENSGISPAAFLKVGTQLNSPVTWEGDFRVPRNATSLEGCPDKVLGFFECTKCSRLKSLKGAPREVGTDFLCVETAIESLEGAPEYVGVDFSCAYCKDLKSLKGAPRRVEGRFDCEGCRALVTLEGAPEYVGGTLSCRRCWHLISLEGAPKHIGESIYCDHCDNLISLEGAPKEVGGIFSCSYCTSLTSLEGAPEKVKGGFYCDHCYSLESLEGTPEYVGGWMVTP